MHVNERGAHSFALRFMLSASVDRALVRPERGRLLEDFVFEVFGVLEGECVVVVHHDGDVGEITPDLKHGAVDDLAASRRCGSVAGQSVEPGAALAPALVIEITNKGEGAQWVLQPVGRAVALPAGPF